MISRRTTHGGSGIVRLDDCNCDIRGHRDDRYVNGDLSTHGRRLHDRLQHGWIFEKVNSHGRGLEPAASALRQFGGGAEGGTRLDGVGEGGVGDKVGGLRSDALSGRGFGHCEDGCRLLQQRKHFIRGEDGGTGPGRPLQGAVRRVDIHQLGGIVKP